MDFSKHTVGSKVRSRVERVFAEQKSRSHSRPNNKGPPIRRAEMQPALMFETMRLRSL